jgi:hypothetical protein
MEEVVRVQNLKQTRMQRHTPLKLASEYTSTTVSVRKSSPRKCFKAKKRDSAIYFSASWAAAAQLQ